MKLTSSEILDYCKRYELNYRATDDEKTEKELKKWFLSNRFLDKSHFVKLGLWKSKRPKKHYENNDNEFIKAITEFALSTKNERARVESLLIIRGVSWPVASTLLHFAYPDKYPIMDFRAIWSLGWEQPKSYNFEFWQKYVDELRKLAKENSVSLRVLDKSLWYYSKENQPGNDPKNEAK